MKRDIILLCIALVAILCAGVAGYMYLTKQEVAEIHQKNTTQTAPSSRLEDDFIEVPVLTFIKEKNSNAELKYTSDISYPSLMLMGHANLAKEANTIIKTVAMDMLHDFEESINGEENILSEDGASRETSDFTMRSNPMLLSPTIVSLRFDTAEYVAGSAHPNQQIHMLNYDIETRRVASTEDLFATSTGALQFLSQFSREVLRNKFTDVSEEEFENMVIPGTTPTLTNFQSVGITKDALIVIFNPYQVAPYARGSQEVRIPLDKISHLLHPRVIQAMELAKDNFTEATPE